MTIFNLFKKLLHHRYSIAYTLHLLKIFKNNKNIYVLINNQVMYYELSK